MYCIHWSSNVTDRLYYRLATDNFLHVCRWEQLQVVAAYRNTMMHTPGQHASMVVCPTFMTASGENALPNSLLLLSTAFLFSYSPMRDSGRPYDNIKGHAAFLLNKWTALTFWSIKKPKLHLFWIYHQTNTYLALKTTWTVNLETWVCPENSNLIFIQEPTSHI